MENTGNIEKVPEKSAVQPTAESLASSAPAVKRSTRRALTANDRLEIAQQAIKDLEQVGIMARVAPLYNDCDRSVVIVLPGVVLVDGRLAINGNGED